MNFNDYNLQSAQDGCVLLLNEKNTLPLLNSEKVSVFGRGAFNYLCSGMGSGGSVHVPYKTVLIEELLKLEEEKKGPSLNKNLIEEYKKFLEENPFDNGGDAWAGEPWSQKEMALNEENVKAAAKISDKALYVISRNAGEDKDLKIQKGSWYLSETEYSNLEKICEHFEKVCVVFNTCGIIDTNFIFDSSFKNHITAAIYVWHGGMEGGKAAADILCANNAVPSGKLADTIAKNIQDYPSTKNFAQDNDVFYAEDIFVGYRYFLTFAPQKILFPFGYGKSYTTFKTEYFPAEVSTENSKTKIKTKVKVLNTGNFTGKEVIQLYLEAPQNKICKASKILCAYKKTPLLNPGEKCELNLEFFLEDFASYDDSGNSGLKNAWILEEGNYFIFAGTDSFFDLKKLSVKKLNCDKKFSVQNNSLLLNETVCVEQLEQAAAPVKPFKRLAAKKINSNSDLKIFEESEEEVPLSTVNMEERIKQNLPEEIPFTGNIGIHFDEVKKSPELMEKFIGQLTTQQLATIIRGEGMMSSKVTAGVTSAFGGLSESLHEYGIPVACTADGPSGIRIDTGKEANLMPIGTCLACTFDNELVAKLYFEEGKELLKNQIDTLLGPGMNIHRNPLNGRNFEYFSEDPFLTGEMAGAQMKALYESGSNGTCKHFACNSQEHRRNDSDSIVSERALREIYLKAFEMNVKNGNMKSLMTCYNSINGHWGASNYDTVNTILHKQWGYKGLVMTDWWAKMNHCISGGEPSIKNTAYMIKARNDVYMIVDNDTSETGGFGDNLMKCLETGELTLSELQLCVKDILNFILISPVSKRELRPLKMIKEFNSKISSETELRKICSSAKIIAAGKDFIPDDETYIYIEETQTLTIRGYYKKDSDDLSQSVTNIFIDEIPAASLESRSTAGKQAKVNAAQIIINPGYYKITMKHTKPGLEISGINFDYRIFTPVALGLVK